eukprot:2044979-Pyramimonas_sp.AAC.1
MGLAQKGVQQRQGAGAMALWGCNTSGTCKAFRGANQLLDFRVQCATCNTTQENVPAQRTCNTIAPNIWHHPLSAGPPF